MSCASWSDYDVNRDDLAPNSSSMTPGCAICGIVFASIETNVHRYSDQCVLSFVIYDDEEHQLKEGKDDPIKSYNTTEDHTFEDTRPSSGTLELEGNLSDEAGLIEVNFDLQTVYK